MSDNSRKELEKLVDRMLALKSQVPQTRTSHDQAKLLRKISAIDDLIDVLIAGLDHLSESDVAKCRREEAAAATA